MKTTIAVVEDDPGLRQQLTEILKSAPDMDCLYTVSSAEEAILRIPKNPPNIVLLDIKLPGMSGIDCLPHLKKAAPDTEILMLTIYEEAEDIFRALKAGASGYLLKSSPPDVLFEAIRDVCSGGTPLSGHIARKVVRYFQSVGQMERETEKLSARELEVLELMAVGFINKEIADKLGVSLQTVKTYVKRIYVKMHARNRMEAVRKHRA
ncbi:MAG TPA: response regulator transcription factor [Rariglobus sp.]|jgi:DNA-binding NarL/FixJ family response regulator|nr:response regulator transcription factor [Rariglobus sp.]